MMDNKDFLDEFERVRAFYQRPDAKNQPEEFKDYNTWLQVIYEKVKWIETIKFREVVNVLLDVRPRFRRDLDHRRIVAICRSGARSRTVAEALVGAGFDVVNVGGGMRAWEAADLPIETDDGSPGSVI